MADRRRPTAVEYAYVAALVAIAILGLLSSGYLPQPPPSTTVFPTAYPVSAGSSPTAPSAAGVDVAPRTYAPRTVGLYQSVDFAAPVPPAQLAGRGSPFDVEAVATFTNPGTGDSFVTEAFYDGGADGVAIYRFRFTPTSLGTWTLTTTSGMAALDGLVGTVEVVAAPDPDTYGFLTSSHGRMAAPLAGTGEVVGVAYQVFMHGGSALEDLGALPSDDGALRQALSALLDEAASYGFDAVFVGVWHQWFDLGTSRSDRHDSVEPDPATFRVLEVLCSMAHARGMFVHIWQWGDEQRRWSPIGIPADSAFPDDRGGVNGVADRRLQRYIAARLGPLPNWVLGYGFDLYEWAEASQVRTWAEYLEAHSARPHLLTAIEQRRSTTRLFDLGASNLGLVSDGAAAEAALGSATASADAARAAGATRDLFSGIMYSAAVSALEAAAGKPVIFENRFLFQHDDVWTMDRTRRTMWALTMAGGVAAVWGVDWDLQELYSHPEQLLTYRAFWNGRLVGAQVSSAHEDGSLRLMSADGDSGVVYVDDASVVALPPLPQGAAVWAVDTLGVYAPIIVDVSASAQSDGEPFSWRAPYASDWAIAIDPAR